jgi:hypothetical protein
MILVPKLRTTTDNIELVTNFRKLAGICRATRIPPDDRVTILADAEREGRRGIDVGKLPTAKPERRLTQNTAKGGRVQSLDRLA